LLLDAHKKPRPTYRSIRIEKVRRGCVNNKHHNRESCFFTIAVEKLFSFRADWHEDDRAKPLVRQYQTALDAVLRSHAELRGCVAHCAHCGIRFFTHPRNAGRRDLRCPFGCRQCHRRERSRQRSTAYYRTSTGKRKKKHLNGHRRQVPASPQAVLDPQTPSDPQAGAAPTSEAPPVELWLEGVVLSESSLAESPLLPYLRMVVGLIEGIELTCHEVLHLLRRAMRQHSIGARSRIDYVLVFLQRHPP